LFAGRGGTRVAEYLQTNKGNGHPQGPGSFRFQHNDAFYQEFLPTIIVSGLIACPIAWIIMQHWLKNYAYRISITSYPLLSRCWH